MPTHHLMLELLMSPLRRRRPPPAPLDLEAYTVTAAPARPAGELAIRHPHLDRRFTDRATPLMAAWSEARAMLARYLEEDDVGGLPLPAVPPALRPHLEAWLERERASTSPHRLRRLWRLGDLAHTYGINGRRG